ncbi:MAG: ThuA domain-containing protein, partial [Verrucomicrobia bacterium]|nr:ThuA domain-containing protein [Verrucomicrobiota bacterium]
MRILPSLCVYIFCVSSTLNAEPIQVLMWDERQPRQEEAYDNFIGNEIVARLKASTNDLEFRSVALDDPEQGLSDDNLAWADVVLWWGHARHEDVSWENAKKVADLVRRGELDLVILHSAHWARPFVELMNGRSIEEGLAYIEQHNPGKKITIETVAPPKERSAPMRGSVFTPAYYGYKQGKTAVHGIIHLPWCCFPDFRADGKPSTLAVKAPKHPIAKGLPRSFQLPATEMYNEPFHIPEPDEVIFEETWKTGERFRSGMVWNIDGGKVFYFRPGHETYPVFKQEKIIQILANACEWLG